MFAFRTLNALARSSLLLPVRTQHRLSMSTRSSDAIYRVALTGGPCGGKSSSLDAIRSHLSKQSIDVYTVPEVPTILLTGGCKYPGIEGGDKLIEFEKALIELQIQMEDSFFKIAKSTGRTSVIVMDRGILDISAYLPSEQWNRLLEVSCLEHDQLLKRYDGVLHLVTAAHGAEKFYKHGEVTDDAGNTVFRLETPNIARELDDKVRDAWSQHPRRRLVGNEADGFEGKMRRSVDFIMEIINGKMHNV